MSSAQNKKFPLGFALALLGLLIFPNLLFWALGKEIFLSRSLVNVDYFLLAAIVIWLPGILRWLSFTLLCALDFLTAAGPAFHFSYRSMLQSVLDTFDLQPELFIPIALAIFIGSACAALVITKSVAIRQLRWLYCLLFLLSGVGLQMLDKQLSANVLPVNFSTSTFGNIARIILADSRRNTPVLETIPDTQPVAADVIWKIPQTDGQQAPQNILLVLVESWGLYKEDAVNQALIKRFDSLAPDFQISSGQVPFKGSTVPGELRELCRLAFSGVHPPTNALAQYDCLPQKLAELGYSTLGIHGYSGTMFKRREWYPTLFGEHIWFVNELDMKLAERSRCGVSFRGICDDTLIDYLANHDVPENDEKRFTYLLTLNSHLPVYQPGNSDISCKEFSTTDQRPQHCYLYQHMVQIFDSVKRFAKQQPESSLIVLVGDHMPPFIKTSDRSAYHDKAVPYLVLRSKKL